MFFKYLGTKKTRVSSLVPILVSYYWLESPTFLYIISYVPKLYIT